MSYRSIKSLKFVLKVKLSLLQITRRRRLEGGCTRFILAL